MKLPTQKKSSKPLVQELDKDGAVVECTEDGFDISDDIDKTERKKKPAVKKGFLRTAKARKAALYPSGSEQGESQKEGTYSRFMSKCKVVDTTTMSKEEVDAATRQYAGTGNVSMPQAPPSKAKPPAPPSKAFDGAKKGFLNDVKLYADNEAKKRTQEYEPEFDAAMAELDPEFSNAHKNDDDDPFSGEDDTIAQLRDFAAKVDWASSDFSKPLAPARDSTKHDHSQRPKPAVETEAKPAPGSRKQDPGELQRGFMARDAERSAAKAAARAARAETFACRVDRTEDGRVRCVVALDGVASFADVDLDVAAKTLRVREKGGRRRSSRVELPCDVDAASASAKFSKKRGQLTVVLSPSAD